MNYYVKNIREIVKLSNERNVDWSVAVSMYDNEHGVPFEDPKEIGKARAEFYEYIEGKRFDRFGNELA